MMYQYSGKCNQHLRPQQFYEGRRYCNCDNQQGQQGYNNGYNNGGQGNGYNNGGQGGYDGQNRNYYCNCDEQQDYNDDEQARNYYYNWQGEGGEQADWNSWDQMYMAMVQQENEKAVCNYIEAVKGNEYDEHGQLVFGKSIWGQNQYEAQLRMSRGHKFWLIVMILACCAMVAKAVHMHGRLQALNIPWRPRRFRAQNLSVDVDNLYKEEQEAPAEADGIHRKNSGITKGRETPGARQSLL